jgi:flagellar hook-associated protein 3 FlgL
MRVTSNSFPNALVDQLSSLAARQSRLQLQAATGQRIQSPEDDPVALRRVLDLQVESSAASQFRHNIARQQELADATFGTMKSLKKISDRASEIATLADGVKSPQELQNYAAEVTELIKQGVQVMNAKNRGDYLFAGTRTDEAPFALTLNAEGQADTVEYRGNTALAEVEIAEGETLSAQTLGANLGGEGPRGLITDSRSGADFFNHLIALQNNLAKGNVQAIAQIDRPQLQRDEENILFHFSSNGAVQAHLEAADTIAIDRGLSLETQVSREVDSDLAQTMVKLSQTQTAYQAALQSGGAILNLSLLDFLR